MKWTHEQDKFLLAHSHKGAEQVRRDMFKEFGVLRSTDAIVRHGNRIGASFTRWDICPSCGRIATSLHMTTGLCPVCHWNKLADEKARIKAELRKLNETAARRRYDKEQKAARREHVKFLNLSEKVSEDLVM